MLSEAHGVSLRITSDVSVRIVYHVLYLGGKALVEREIEKIPFKLKGEAFEPEGRARHQYLNITWSKKTRRGPQNPIVVELVESLNEDYSTVFLDFNDFLTLYPIPSEYRVILPKSNQTVFEAPPRFIYRGSNLLVVLSSPLLLSCAKLIVVSHLLTSSEGSSICVKLKRAFRNFIYTEDDKDLLFLPKEPSPGFGTGSPSVLNQSTEASESQRRQLVSLMSLSLKIATHSTRGPPTSKISVSNVAEKERLEAIEVSLCKEVEELKQDRREVVSKVIPYAVMELVYSDDIDPLAPIKVLLSKKPPSLQRHVPSRTQVPLPTSQRATPSSAPVSYSMSPPTDAFVVKP
ncbi:hypothetical protein Tco_0459495 [Tanacetum coccineum]